MIWVLEDGRTATLVIRSTPVVICALNLQSGRPPCLVLTGSNTIVWPLWSCVRRIVALLFCLDCVLHPNHSCHNDRPDPFRRVAQSWERACCYGIHYGCHLHADHDMARHREVSVGSMAKRERLADDGRRGTR